MAWVGCVHHLGEEATGIKEQEALGTETRVGGAFLRNQR